MDNMIERGPSAPKGSTIDLIHGKRRVTVYTLAEDTLENLGTLQFIASLCFAVALSLFSFCGGAFMSISLAGNTAPEAAVATWNTIKWITMIFGIISIAASIAAHVKYTSKWDKIKKETIHHDDAETSLEPQK